MSVKLKTYSLTKTISKLLSSFTLFILLTNSTHASELTTVQKLKYYTTHVDDLGYNYNSSRPGLNLQLHFFYPLAENVKIKSLNYISEGEDEFQDDKTYNFKFNQKLAIDFTFNSFIISPYGKMINYDKNPAKQSDNSHAGLSVTKKFNQSDLTIDYRDELSKGSKIGSNKVYQNVFGLYYNKKQFLNSSWDLKLGYTEVQSVRGTKLIKFSNQLTDKIEFAIKYLDNDGKGAFGSNNIDENRKYLISEIGYRF